MKHQRHFETQVEARMIAAAQINSLVNALARGVQLLDCEIATEEERSRCYDYRDSAYSTLALSLTGRRDNLALTIAALHERLEEYSTPTAD